MHFSVPRWSAASALSTIRRNVSYDFGEDPLAAFKTFQNLLTNPMVPKLKPGFWGIVDEDAESWQKPRRFLEGNESSSGDSSTRLLEDEPGQLSYPLPTRRALSEEFELLSDEIIANYSAFRGFRIYECVDENTCLGTVSHYLQNSANLCAENRRSESAACSDCKAAHRRSTKNNSGRCVPCML